MKCRPLSVTRIMLFLFCLTLPYAACAESQKRVALVIGNGSYRNVPRLSNPPNDAEDMAAALSDLGFAVTKLVDADLASMESARRSFADVAKGAEVRLFFYAGHGVQAAGENWLIPVDADVREDYELKTKAVSAQAVLDGLEAAGSGVNIVILDACRDNPFKASSRSAGAGRGLAIMGIRGSLIAYATAPGQTAQDGAGRNGVFTGAFLAEIGTPGRSVQELMTAVTARVINATGGLQTPWVNTSLPKLFYFVTPEDAKARFDSRIADGEAALKSLDDQLAALKTTLGAESDAAKRQALDVEIKKQAALGERNRQDTEALKTEKERQEAAAKAQAEEAVQLAAFKADQSAREEAIRKAAEARRMELESLKAGTGGVSSYLLAIETARSAQAEIEKQYTASLAMISASMAGTYNQKLAALAGWTMDPWENEREFKARVGAESTRLSSEKQAALAGAQAENDAKKNAALVPFQDVERGALASLQGAHFTYTGSTVKLEVGAFDRDEKFFPITLTSTVSELPFTQSFKYSIKSDTTDELKKRYLEFDSWQKADALFGEIETSVASAGNVGFVSVIEAYRLKALEPGGERLIYEEKLAKPVACFSGSADRTKPKPIASFLVVLAPVSEISVNGAVVGNDRGFIINPKPGNYTVRAKLADGTILEERRNLTAKAGEKVVFVTTGSVAVEAKTAGELRVDGIVQGNVEAGKSFLVSELAAGNHELELLFAGGNTEKLTVAVKARAKAEAKFVFEGYLYNRMVLIDGGIFRMGDSVGDGIFAEKPVHSVTVSSFYLAKYEVTQKEWRDVMGAIPSIFKGDELPVENVSWFDAVEYCNRLSAKNGLDPCYTISGATVTCDFTKNGFRLPTEAEWEFGAKGGTRSSEYKYAGGDDIDSVGWYDRNSGNTTHPVGQKLPNELGLFDMTGNVEEWCWDWRGEYSNSPQTDPLGAFSGDSRILRGGSWYDDVYDERISFRGEALPDLRNDCIIGFRVAARAP